jgi:hypothetical protein
VPVRFQYPSHPSLVDIDEHARSGTVSIDTRPGVLGVLGVLGALGVLGCVCRADSGLNAGVRAGPHLQLPESLCGASSQHLSASSSIRPRLTSTDSGRAHYRWRITRIFKEGRSPNSASCVMRHALSLCPRVGMLGCSAPYLSPEVTILVRKAACSLLLLSALYAPFYARNRVLESC